MGSIAQPAVTDSTVPQEATVSTEVFARFQAVPLQCLAIVPDGSTPVYRIRLLVQTGLLMDILQA